MRDHRAFPIVLAAFCGLSGCGQGDDAVAPNVAPDPLLMQALNDQLMVDPDLAMQNEANAALTVSFDRTLPQLDASPETIAVVRDEMRMKLLEGGAVLDLPKPQVPAGQPVASERGQIDSCAKGQELDRSAIWAARLPGYAAIPPRGATIAGAGRDLPGCKLRLVTYRSPLNAEEAMQFHYTLATRAGLKPSLYAGKNGLLELIGNRDSVHLAVRTVPSPDGLVTVEIASLEPA